MERNVKDRSICSNCNHAGRCIHMEKASQPILFCEEYDGYVTHPSPAIQPHRIAADPPVDEQNPREYKGLCINCDHRDTCRYATQEGGVWHCEEYQ